jgi:hypothetical protein
MGDRINQPGRLRVFRDEDQDLVPLDFGPLLAAARGRADEDNLKVPDETETPASNDAGDEN